MGSVTNTYTATFTPSVSGAVTRDTVNESLSTIRAGAGNDAGVGAGSGFVELIASVTTNQFNTLARNIIVFDTSTIPSGSTIVSAALNLYGNAATTQLGTTTLEVVSSSPASTSTLANADYGTLGSTSFASVAFASFNQTSNNSISLNSSGLSNITPNSFSKFGIRLGWDFNNSFTGSWGLGQLTYIPWTYSSTTLVVTYTRTFPTLAITGPSSIANIQTITTS